MKRFRQFALPRVEIRGYITKHAQPRLRPQVKKRRKKCSGRLCTALPQSRPTSPTRSLTWRKHRACWKKNGPVPGMRTGSTGGPPPYWNIFIPSNLVGRKHNLRLSFRNAFAVCNVAFAREIYPVSFREPMFSQISIFLLSRSHVLLSRAIMLQDFKLQSTAYVISNTYLYTAFTYDPLHLVCVSM